MSAEPFNARWFFVPNGDPTQSVELTDWSGTAVIEDVPDLYEPFRPGDSVDVYPVRTADGVQGYVAVRSTPYADGMSESSPEIVGETGDAPDVRTWILEDGSETDVGPVERALREDVSRLKTTAHFGTTLLASATALAQAMDRAQPDKIASIGREFREHLKRIEDLSGDDNESVQHTANLSTPV